VNGETAGPLAGVTVVDLGRFVAGPVTASLLSDFGARVIKVERPGAGDEIRHLGPLLPDGSAWWLVEGRNKECITLNLARPRGREIFLDHLLPMADVVVENFRPGTLEHWNLGYDVIAERNPRAILLRTSGYGQDGPYRLLPGLNTAGEALGGLRYIVGEPDRPPARPGISLADYSAAFTGAIGVLVALYERDRQGGSGLGQTVDNTLYEAVMRIMEWTFAAYDRLGLVRERVGAGSFGTVPARAYLSRDGKWVGIAASGEPLFRRLAAAIGRPELVEDERFSTNERRMANRAAIDGILEAWAEARPASEIVRLLQEAAVPVNLVYSAADVFEDRHVAARQSLVPVPDGEGRPVRMQNVTPRLSRTPGRLRWAGRSVGADNARIYGAWLTPDEQEALRRDGVI
jgi:formyl-CoA transferase